MKNLFYLVLTSLLLISCEINYFESEEKENNQTENQTENESAEDPNQLTQKQISFIQKVYEIASPVNIVSVQWRDNKNLDVHFDNKNLVKQEGSDEALQKAILIADGLASDGLSHTDKDICVYVYNQPSSDVLAKSCAKKINYDVVYELDRNFFKNSDTEKTQLTFDPQKGLTLEQVEFAYIILHDNSVIDTDWQDNKTLHVTFQTEVFVSRTDSLNHAYYCKKKAGELAYRGFEYTDKPFCVEIFNKMNSDESSKYKCRSCIDKKK
ncbi:MAG: hypothetical protein ACTSX1_05155 [Candidatus Heimdallarchaeaceae archaeon]